MRRFALLALAAWALAAGAVRAGEQKLHPLAADVVLDGMIVVLDVPATWERDGESVDIVWDTAAGERYLFSEQGRAGRHAYDPRGNPPWHGRAAWVGTNVSGRGEFKFPSLGDEVDIFLAPEPLLPATVNAMRGHRFFACSWDMLLLLLFGVAAATFYFVTRCSLAVALVAGFAVAWIALDLRMMADHVSVVRRLEQNGRSMPVLAEVQSFGACAAEAIGPHPWTFDPAAHQEVAVRHVLGYALAEQPYLPPEEAERAEFLVSLEAKSGKVVCQRGPYRLLRRERP